MSSVAQQLSWEARWRPWAAASALLAGVLTLGGGVALALAFRGLPNNSPALVLFMKQHASGLVLISIVLGLGAFAIAPALVFLAKAAKFRRPDLWPVALYLTIFGPIALGLASIGQQVVLSHAASNFARTGAQTYFEARHVLTSGPMVAAASVRLAGQLALGFSLVLVGLYGMRAGLLTRFMGVLGIVVGVLFVLPIGSPLPIVQAFWLIALGVLLTGRWPKGVPPAWTSGKDEPWPSIADMRAQQKEPQEKVSEAAQIAAEHAKVGHVPSTTNGNAPHHSQQGRSYPALRRNKRRRHSR